MLQLPTLPVFVNVFISIFCSCEIWLQCNSRCNTSIRRNRAINRLTCSQNLAMAFTFLLSCLFVPVLIGFYNIFLPVAMAT